MNNILKIGIISGLIAGIVAGSIHVSIIVPLIFELGLPYWSLPPPPETPFMKIAMTEITFNMIWGIILGIIFSRIYDLIPGKGVSKGLIFGLAYYLIYSIKSTAFMAAYGNYPVAIGSLLLIHPIIYGLVLGILFKAPKPKLKIIKHDIMSGLYTGIITTFVFSMTIIILYYIQTYFGAIIGLVKDYPDYLTDIGFIIAQFGSHAVINLFHFCIYGIFYARFYERIPGKDVLKGSIFGLVIFVITTWRFAVYWFSYGSLDMAIFCGLTSPGLYIFIGLLFEGFYKKRARAFLVAGVVFIIMIITSIIMSAWSAHLLWLGFFTWVIYGLVLGALYKLEK
jgi:hypothetical protein